MDIYFEQNVVNNNIDERTKRTKTLVLAKNICYVLGLFVLVSSALMINMFWLFIIFAIPFVVAGFVLGMINKRNNMEFDYVLDDESLRISEIYFRRQRKLKHKIALRSIESVGVFGSDGYRKAERVATKKLLAIVNYDDEKAIVYILFNTEKGRKLLFIEPNREFMISLRRVVSAYSIFDKSISDFEKYITKKEEELRAAAELYDDDDDDIDDEEAETDKTAENAANDANSKEQPSDRIEQPAETEQEAGAQ